MKPDLCKPGHIASGGPLIHVQDEVTRRNTSRSVRRHLAMEKLREMPVPVLNWGAK